MNRTNDNAAMMLAAGLAAIAAVLWAGGALAALVCGHRVPHGHPLAGVLAFAHLGHPSIAWGGPIGPPMAYWSVSSAVVAAAVGAAIYVYRLVSSFLGRQPGTSPRGDGFATRGQVRAAAGVPALMRRGAVLRPHVARPQPTDLCYRLGRAAGTDCWVSVEDSLVILGPPRAGKGLHLVIPGILDAPGAVITTSTRPDNLATTIRARSTVGPVAVFDPQRLAPGVASSMRWSPIRGCEAPRTAMERASALCAEPASGVENASFWTQQCTMVVRCLLHAAALDQRPPVELYRWSLSPLAAQDATDILSSHPRAATGWSTALEAVLAADPRQRDSTWSMVANTFAALADPGVLDAVSPSPGEHFDPDRFLRDRGTVYLLGTAGGAAAAANLVAAFIEDIIDAARRLAARTPGARLDPPLAVILDEAANYPLASLPSLMSDGGGTGITPIVVLQSLAQARARWGEHESAAIWDAAIVKLILGGSGHADDLRDLSALLGTHDERTRTESWGPDGRRTATMTSHEVPVLDTGRLRTLPFGHAVLLLRSAPPIRLALQPWTRRHDATLRQGDRVAIESTLQHADAESSDGR